MSVSQIIQIGTEIIASVVVFVAGIGYLFSLFNSGIRTEKKDVMSSADQLATFWKEQVDGFKEVVKELTAKLDTQKDAHNDEMKKVMTELGEVRGRLGAETKAKEEYLAILQNRDPETKKFMEIMLSFVEAQNKTNQDIARILADVYKFSKAEHERDFHIDATVSKV